MFQNEVFGLSFLQVCVLLSYDSYLSFLNRLI